VKLNIVIARRKLKIAIAMQNQMYLPCVDFSGMGDGGAVGA
jgi:hypothetical protein